MRREREVETEILYRRLIALAFLLLAALCAVGFRLVDLQVLRHDQLRAMAEGNAQRLYVKQPPRGDIRDAQGNILTRSVFVKDIAANPMLVGPYHREVARALAPLLQLDERQLAEKLKPSTYVDAKGRERPDQWERLKRKVPVAVWEEIQKTMEQLDLGIDEENLSRSEQSAIRELRTRAIYAEGQDLQVRLYPNGSLGAHVLGFIGHQEVKTSLGSSKEAVGRDGVERVWNEALSGVAGWRATEVDRFRKEMVPFREQDVAAKPGLNVILTLDAGVQHIAETELRKGVEKHHPVGASCVVVDPKSGAILAMANWPTFDPTDLGDSKPDERRNRCITDVLEPGSTFKIVPLAAALQEDVVELEDVVDCENGRFWYGRTALQDHHAYGELTVQQIITKSSNIGMAKISMRLGEQKLYDYMRAFGFGRTTGFALPGEVAGLLYPVERWTKVSITRLPMGHEVAVTPLQMTMAMAAVANGGKLMEPRIVDRLEDADGDVVVRYGPKVKRRVIEPETAELVVKTLRTVVEKGGTATQAALEHYSVAGKTGTAQKAMAGGYPPGKYFSSFIGFFPATDPQLCIAVIFDEPRRNGYYGGIVAAPVFKAIAERSGKYLAIEPDLEQEGDEEEDAGVLERVRMADATVFY